MSAMATLAMLLRMGLRNLAAHRVKSTVVGAIMFFGTFLVVFGTAMLDSVQASMARSITSSLAGHAQVYSSQADDPLELFPSGSMSSMDYGEIEQFGRLRDALLEVDNVRDVVPMGITSAIVFGGTELDRVLEQLRAAVEAGDGTARDLYAAHVRAIAAGIRRDVEGAIEFTADPDASRRELADLDLVATPAFWQGLETDPQGTLQFLDTKVAPTAADGRMLYLRVIGTDLEQFSHQFQSFELVEGSLPPPGTPGVLLAQRFHEKQSKDKVARDLDQIKEGRDEGLTLAEDEVLALVAERLPKQVQKVVYQLDPAEAEQVSRQLRDRLPGVEGDTTALLSALLTLDDDNFDAHYATFYEVVAPRIRLYEIPVGSDVVLRGFTKSGYARAEKVRVWGIFTFTGLEGSDLAGINNLVDLESFRSLYGRMTASQQAELSDIRAAAGVTSLERQDAEAALFGGPPAVPATEPPATEVPATEAPPTADLPADDSELVLNAAVILDDPRRLDQTLAAMRARVQAEGLPVQVVDWQEAAGIVGQIVVVLQVVLYVAIFIIFLVALVIINNTMVMATLERTVEIGTMRAIGAQRSLVILLFVIETVLLGVVAGGMGALAGVGAILWLHDVGVPAVADILVLLFAGRRLYPEVGPLNVLLGVGTILLISMASTLYPAVLAARVPPVVAMSGKE